MWFFKLYDQHELLWVFKATFNFMWLPSYFQGVYIMNCSIKPMEQAFVNLKTWDDILASGTGVFKPKT